MSLKALMAFCISDKILKENDERRVTGRSAAKTIRKLFELAI